MKTAINMIKKTFIIFSVAWTLFTIGIFGYITFSGPSSCSVDDAGSQDTGQLSDDLPDFEFEAMNTESALTNESIAGTYTLLYFWGTSCGICRDEIPRLYDTYAELQDQNFQVIAISYDPDEDKVREFMEDNPMPWKHTVIGSDREKAQETFREFGVSGVPHKILVSPQGEILENKEGSSGDNLYELISSHLPAS